MKMERHPVEEEVNILGPVLLGSIRCRHAIDVMNLTKNLCMNLLGFLGTYGKDKYTLESRRDLEAMNERDRLHLENRGEGRHYLVPASYTFSKKRKRIACLNA